MSDDPIMISPAGIIAQYNYPSYPFRGVGQGPYTVVPVAAHGATIARGTGDFKLSTVTAAQGDMDIQVVTPTAGTAVSIAFLVDNGASPTTYLGVGLDSSNRPEVFIKDVNGVTVARVTPGGSAIAAGVPLTLRLSWNASAAVRGSHFVYFKVNGAFVAEGTWSTYPSSGWAPFVPALLQLGIGNVAGLADFPSASGIASVQVSNSVTQVATDALNIYMTAGSSLSASLSGGH